MTDLRMKQGDGLERPDAASSEIDPTVPVMIMTAFGAIDSAVEAMRRGAFHYITKPFAARSRCARWSSGPCRERALSTRERAACAGRCGRARRRGSCSARAWPMRQLRALIEQVADAASTVLITGETGTGKELVARAIHAGGPRARPAVRRGQLRGAARAAPRERALRPRARRLHRRGAATGAGCSSEAQGGTIFLDEIGDLPLALQAKLLRVLQAGEVRPVGSETTRDRRRALHRRHAQGSRAAGREGPVPRGSVLPAGRAARRRSRRCASAPTTSPSWSSTSWPAAASARRSRSLAGVEPDALDFLAGCELARQRPPAREPGRAAGRHRVRAARAARRRQAGARDGAGRRSDPAPGAEPAEARRAGRALHRGGPRSPSTAASRRRRRSWASICPRCTAARSAPPDFLAPGAIIPGMELAERHVVITGAAGGLGPAVVDTMLAAGAICHLPVRADADRLPRHARILAVEGVDLADEVGGDVLLRALSAAVGVDPPGGRIQGGADRRHVAGRSARAAGRQPGDGVPLQPRGRAQHAREGGGRAASSTSARAPRRSRPASRSRTRRRRRRSARWCARSPTRSRTIGSW